MEIEWRLSGDGVEMVLGVELELDNNDISKKEHCGLIALGPDIFRTKFFHCDNFQITMT